MAIHESSTDAFKRCHPDFDVILGDAPSFSLILEISPANNTDDPAKTPQLFHEAGVWVRHTQPMQRDEIYITSNILGNGDSTKRIEIASLELPGSNTQTLASQFDVQYKQKPYSITSTTGVKVTQHGTPAAIPMGNGGTAWGSRILCCNQGQDQAMSKALSSQSRAKENGVFPGGLVAVRVQIYLLSRKLTSGCSTTQLRGSGRASSTISMGALSIVRTMSWYTSLVAGSSSQIQCVCISMLVTAATDLCWQIWL